MSLKSSQKHVLLCVMHCVGYNTVNRQKRVIPFARKYTDQQWERTQANRMCNSLWRRPSATPICLLRISIKYLLFMANVHLRFGSLDLRLRLHRKSNQTFGFLQFPVETSLSPSFQSPLTGFNNLKSRSRFSIL